MNVLTAQSPRVRGRCPGALQPMLSADGLLMRIRPPMGRLLQEQAFVLADLLERYADGQMTLTSRGNLQLRGVEVHAHASLVGALTDVGLLDASVEQEQRRNVVHTPFWQEGDASHLIGKQLINALGRANAPELPDKFGYAVDAGTWPVLQSTSADIRLERSISGQLLCVADGSDSGIPVTVDTAVDTALALARWFVDSGGVQQGRGRMASHLAGGAQLPYGLQPMLPVSSAAITAPVPGGCDQGWLVATAFGVLTSNALRAMAAYTALRITPWRMVLIEGLQQEPAMGLDEMLYPDDPRLNVYACTGAPGCPQAHSTTRKIAAHLAQQLRPGQSLHVSGCAKGCAQPDVASVTLVATAEDEFSLVRQGRACDTPIRTGLQAHNLMCEPDLWQD